MYHSRIGVDPQSRIDARRDLACRVRALRLEQFLTQDELSELSGVGRATVARIEGGKAIPQARAIKALARALGVGPIDLVREPQRLWGDIRGLMLLQARDWSVLATNRAGARTGRNPGLASLRRRAAAAPLRRQRRARLRRLRSAGLDGPGARAAHSAPGAHSAARAVGRRPGRRAEPAGHTDL
jgi:transcriptional regulator with XRE-family HTH domain